MKLWNIFSTEKQQDLARSVAREKERAVAAGAANIASFRARRLASEDADKKAARRSPAEAIESRGKSKAERRKCTPCV
jgi:hypothetical protein